MALLTTLTEAVRAEEPIAPAMGSKVAIDIGARLRARWREIRLMP
jgi:hypothetical protein